MRAQTEHRAGGAERSHGRARGIDRRRAHTLDTTTGLEHRSLHGGRRGRERQDSRRRTAVTPYG